MTYLCRHLFAPALLLLAGASYLPAQQSSLADADSRQEEKAAAAELQEHASGSNKADSKNRLGCGTRQ